MNSPIRSYLSSLPRFGLLSLSAITLAACASVMADARSDPAHTASDDRQRSGSSIRHDDHAGARATPAASRS